MHKKRIEGRTYFYTSFRGKDSKVNSKYLGRNKFLAWLKEFKFKKLGNSTIKLWFFPAIFLLFFFLPLLDWPMLGFVSYGEGSVVQFDVDMNWNLTESYVRVSMDDYFEDVPLVQVLVNNSAIFDVDSFDLGFGDLYFDLIVDQALVQSQKVTVLDSKDNKTQPSDYNLSDPVNISEPLNETFIINKTTKNKFNVTKPVYGLPVIIDGSVELPILNNSYNETIELPILNQTLNETNISFDNVTLGNQSFNNVSYNETDVAFIIIQGTAEIGKPVKWKVKFNLDKEKNVEVPKPTNAENFRVIRNWRSGLGIMAMEEPIIINDTIVLIQNASNFTEMEYETESPMVDEFNISSKAKRVVVYSDIHYTNISTYTTVPDSSNVQLYLVENGSRTKFAANYSDTNNNTLVDYVWWITPHLSNKTFDVEYGIFAAPTQGNPILNASSWANLTADNLTAFNISTADVDLDGVKNWYVWYLNGTPFTVSSWNFDVNESGGAGKTKDY
ncbi:MAG: hypothetical protein ABIF40_05820, partial [archaeon]